MRSDWADAGIPTVEFLLEADGVVVGVGVLGVPGSAGTGMSSDLRVFRFTSAP